MIFYDLRLERKITFQYLIIIMVMQALRDIALRVLHFSLIVLMKHVQLISCMKNKEIK